jgi:hypothetical protein
MQKMLPSVAAANLDTVLLPHAGPPYERQERE